MKTFLWRVTGAMVLNPNAYENVEADSKATPQAALVVALASLSAGLGTFGFSMTHLAAIMSMPLIALALWVVWAMLTYQIGAWMIPALQTQATPGQLRRTLGFASAPGLFQAAAALPGLHAAVFGVTAVWMLAAMIVAVRQALDYTSTARAVLVCGIGWSLALGITFIIGLFFGTALS